MKIYVISESAAGPCTIQRLRSLQSGNYRRLSLNFSCEVSHARRAEKLAHSKAAPNRISGEWFGISAVEAIRIVKLACRELGMSVSEESGYPPAFIELL